MTVLSSTSSLALQLLTTNSLNNEQKTLAQLNQQLASGKKYSDLTDYAPVDAHNMMNFQNAITQSNAYISTMQTVNARLSLYDTTMSGMETIASQAAALAAQNPTLSSNNVSQLHAQVQSYLSQLTDNLNQQMGGRYIYAGSRYTTAPVADLASLSTTPSLPFTATASPALTTYDSQYVPSNSLTINSAPASASSTFTVGSVAIKWSDLEAGTVSTVTVNGVSQSVTVSGLATPGGSALTPTQLASNLSSTLNQLSSQGLGLSTLSATPSGAQVSLSYTGDPLSITPDSGGTSSEISWSNGTGGTLPETLATTNSSAYTQDSASIDTSYNVTYGVTSNATGIQQLVAGLQLIAAATQTGTTSSTYQTNMTAANDLISQALSNIQSAHSVVASNINTLKQETTIQNTDITNMQSQLGDIQNVDLTSVGTQINLLQTQLQASYSATASIEQLSLVKYL